MTYEDAIEEDVTILEAIREIRKHGFEPSIEGMNLVADGEVVATMTLDGTLPGKAVLDWLGY